MTDLSEKDFDYISIVASRKAEFYRFTKNRLMELLKKQSPDSSVSDEEVDMRLRKSISELDNLLFLSEEEKTTNTIEPTSQVQLSQKSKDEIQERLIRAMTKD